MVSKTLIEKVIESLENISDDHILQSLLNLIELESDKDVQYEFDKDQLTAIELAKKEVREGKTQTEEDANKKIEELKMAWD